MNIYRCTLEVMKIQLKYFVFFPMYLKDKAFKYLKNQSFFWQFQATLHMLHTYVIYLDIGRDDYNDCDDDGESSNEDYYK